MRLSPSVHLLQIVLLMWLMGAVPDIALGSEILGIPRIVDGDTVQIGTAKIRLEGIDSPETDQLCLDGQGKRWTCGIEARDRLTNAKGRRQGLDVPTNSVDRYGRALDRTNDRLSGSGAAKSLRRQLRRRTSRESKWPPFI